MATEFNYVVNVDTTRVMGAMAEVRSQVGMALGGPTGFATPAAGLPGAGFSDVSGGVSSGFAQMAAGFARGPGFMGGMAGMVAGSSFGGTFTNPAMAYTPHYGAIQAETSLQQEWLVHRYGMPAAQLLKPPGVSGAEYAIGVEKNFIDRQIEATHMAGMGARTAFLAGAGGLIAGEGGQIVGGLAGGIAGGRIATRMFGAGAAGAGRMVGGLAGGLGGFMLAQDFVGGAIQEHFAQVEQIGGVTRELGEIAGAGRGLGRGARYELGVSARQAARDLGMDVQEMGDILALGRQNGMLPTATDPNKAREQFRDFARAVEEGAQILHTSLGNAARMIKGMTNLGYGAEEGIVKLVGMAGAAGVSPSAMYGLGMAGAGFARQNLLSGSQGFGLFTGAVGGHGLGREELSMIGGPMGAAQMIASTQIGAALSPMGDMQLMAATGGQALGGMLSMPGVAIGAMAEGGDVIGNMIRFETHKREMLRGTGASGIRTMARQQLSGVADIIQDLSPSLSENDAMRFAAMQMYGLNEVQAKAYVGSVSRGGGGGGGGASRAYQLEAMQGLAMGRGAAQAGIIAPTASGVAAMVGLAGEFGLSEAAEGAMTGALLGNAIPIPGIGAVSGAIIGGVGGFLHQNWAGIKTYVGGGPGLFASAEEKADYYQRTMSSEYESRMGDYKRKIGYLEIDREVAAKFYGADLRGTRLNFDAAARSPVASAQTEAMFQAMGLAPVAAGPGTMRVGGDYYSTSQVQALYRQPLYASAVTERDIGETRGAAYGAVYSADAAQRYGGGERMSRDIEGFKLAYETLVAGQQVTPKEISERYGGTWLPLANVKDNMLPTAKRLIENIPDQKMRNQLLAKIAQPGGIRDPDVRAFLSQAVGMEIQDLPGSMFAGRAGAVAGKGLIESSMSDEALTLRHAFGGTFSSASSGDEANYRNNLAKHQAEWDRLHPGVSSIDSIYATRPSADNYEAFRQRGVIGKLSADELQSMSAGELAQLTAPGSGGAAPAAMLGKYYQGLVQQPDYIKGMAAAARGDRVGANRLIQSAQQATVMSGGGEFRGLHVEDIDVGREFHRRDAPGQIARTLGLVGGLMGVDTDEMFGKVDKLLGAKVFSKTSLIEEAKEAHRTVNRLKPRRKRAGMVQRAIGFGQQEDAMSTINKSLKRTHSMIESLHKKVSGGGPSAGGNATSVKS